MSVEAKFKESGGGKVAAMLVAAMIGGGGHAAYTRVTESSGPQVSITDPVIVELRSDVQKLDARVRAGEIVGAGLTSDIASIKSSLTRLEDILRRERKP